MVTEMKKWKPRRVTVTLTDEQYLELECAVDAEQARTPHRVTVTTMAAALISEAISHRQLSKASKS